MRRSTRPRRSTACLIRANPYDPGKTDDLVCDLCTAMPKPTDDGKTYTFKIREGVKFTDGSPLTAEDVAASWNEIIFPPEGVISARQSNFVMVDKVEATDPTHRGFPAEIRHRRVSAGIGRPLCLDL